MTSKANFPTTLESILLATMQVPHVSTLRHEFDQATRLIPLRHSSFWFRFLACHPAGIRLPLPVLLPLPLTVPCLSRCLSFCLSFRREAKEPAVSLQCCRRGGCH